jgi:DNA-binding NtrC family response regulator
MSDTNHADRFVEALANSPTIGFAIAGGANWRVEYANQRFQEWFPAPSDDLSLTRRLPGLNEERARRKIDKGHSYAFESELKIGARTTALRTTLSEIEQTGRRVVLAETVDITKQKEQEYMLNSFAKLADNNKIQLEKANQALSQKAEELQEAYDLIKAQTNRIARELKVARELLKEARRRVEGPLLGDSPALRGLREEITALAQNDETAVLVGPVGTGKETIARAVHHESKRASHAFIHVNCSMLQTGSYSLFGDRSSTEGGSGRFDLALGGTLYLDGLNHLPLDAQQRLAQVLESQRSGGNPDVRMIVSNTSSLDDDLQNGLLEPDLHRCLAGRQHRVPTLAERREDIPKIAEHFYRQHARLVGKMIDSISEDSLDRLQKYRWPGNIKELRSVIERAVLSNEGTVLEVDDDLLAGGISVGSYRLIERLGRGGMGEVWLAKHQLLARPAAVKLIRPDVFGQGGKDDNFRQRFQREAQATAKLRSPHTVELYDFGISGTGSFYYVMEHLEGLNLEQMVRSFGPLPAERAIEFLKQACRALSEAHQEGLVHRDIKPANLFACHLGTNYDFLKVLDFGMVKNIQAEQESTQLTAVGSALGTPAYMAPEAVSGGEVDSRTDLYSLGCVGFWLLTGCRVFEAENPTKIILSHIQEQPSAPSSVSGLEIPQDLDLLVLRCLAKVPGERPATAEELWQALDVIPLENPWTHSRALEWWRLYLPETSSA